MNKIGESISKITRATRAGGVAQATESLPSKYEALSSNPCMAKKKKEIVSRRQTEAREVLRVELMEPAPLADHPSLIP
jgi:hypothetical protein